MDPMATPLPYRLEGQRKQGVAAGLCGRYGRHAPMLTMSAVRTTSFKEPKTSIPIMCTKPLDADDRSSNDTIQVPYIVFGPYIAAPPVYYHRTVKSRGGKGLGLETEICNSNPINSH